MKNEIMTSARKHRGNRTDRTRAQNAGMGREGVRHADKDMYSSDQKGERV